MYEAFRKSYEVPPFFFRNYTELSEEEKLEVLRCRNAEEVRKWMCSTDEIEVENHLAYIERLKESDTNFYWAVYDSNGNFLGGISLVGMKDWSADSGIFLNPEFIGSGLGSKISIASMEFYFKQMGMKSIYSVVNAGNVQAILMNKRLGCIFGEEKDGFLPVSLSAAQWEQKRGKLLKLLKF